MNVIAVRLAVNGNLKCESELHCMLETLFSSKMTVQEKEFGMRMTEAVKEGANSMCNYSDFVEEQGKSGANFRPIFWPCKEDDIKPYPFVKILVMF